MDEQVRVPKQKRAIEKKDKIIEAGFELICENGYYNTNTAEIAKKAGVSTGIIYQYFKDKHDILMEALNKYGEDLFFPTIKTNINKNNFEESLRTMIKDHIKEHKISKIAHEEITSMIHSDPDVANYYYTKELETSSKIKKNLLDNGFNNEHLDERVHIMIGMIDNLCHEVTYHKHHDMNYDIMTDIVINNIKELFK